MAQEIVTITDIASGDVYNIAADAITYVVDNGSAREVTFVDQIKGPQKITTTDALNAIATSSIFEPITSSETGQAFGLNADRVNAIFPSSTLASGVITITSNSDLTDTTDDSFTIGGDTYTADAEFAVGADDTAPELEVTAVNLAAAINSISTVVSASSVGAVVTVTAIVGQANDDTVFTYTDNSSAGATISGSGTLDGGTTLIAYFDEQIIGQQIEVLESPAAVAALVNAL